VAYSSLSFYWKLITELRSITCHVGSCMQPNTVEHASPLP